MAGGIQRKFTIFLSLGNDQYSAARISMDVRSW